MKKEQFICMGLVCAIFWGCSGKKADYRTSTADTVSLSTSKEIVPDTEFSRLKLVKTADMKFKVKDVEKTGEDISNLTTKLNGMVMHHTMASTVQKSEDIPLNNDSVRHVTSYNTTAELIVQIPPTMMESFMNEVSKMAVYIDARNMDVQDKTLDYAASKMKIANRSQTIRLQQSGKVKIKDSTDFLSAKDDLVDRKISNLRTDAAAKYSTIALTLYQSTTITKTLVANDDPSAYQLSVSNRLGMAFQNGWSILNEILIFIINIWPLIVACIVGWLIYRYIKKKQALSNLQSDSK